MAGSNAQRNREGMARGAEGDFRSSPGVSPNVEGRPKLSDMMKSYRGWWNLPRKASARKDADLRSPTP